MSETCWCLAGDEGREHDSAADMGEGYQVYAVTFGSGCRLHIKDAVDEHIALFSFDSPEQALVFAERLVQAVKETKIV